MCGIGGILRITPPGEAHEPIPEAWLDAIDEAIKWRGPDGAGRFRDKVVKPDGTTVEVALVHRRLSIIDIEGGAQPMVRGGGADGSGQDLIALVFNGCIYNHRALRAELEAGGCRFESDHSDTEVIAQTASQLKSLKRPIDGDDDKEYQPYAELDGMYAAALWDRRSALLVLMADQFAEKPLFVWQAGDQRLCAFASSPTAFLELSRHGVVHRAEMSRWRIALAEWIALGSYMIPPCKSITQCQWEDGPLIAANAPEQPRGTRIANWSLSVLVAATAILFPTTAAVVLSLLLLLCLFALVAVQRQRRRVGIRSTDNLDHLLEAAVVERLEADVPLGCFLSGGIDSSLIALYAKKSLGRLTTLCVRMPDDRYDESTHAQRVAEHLGTDHITLDVETSAADDLVHLIGLMGLPFGDSSLLPTYWLCRAARKHVKVALSGDGGDELFMGYERYRAARWLPLARLVAWAMPRDAGDHPDPTARDAKEARFWNAARGVGYTDLVSIFPSEMQRELFSGPRTVKGRTSRPSSQFLGRGQARRFDLEHYLPADLLRKTDTASMAAGLEVRCPFLDKQLAAAARATPVSTLMRGNTAKAMLRELAAKHLPAEIVNRPKQGFAIPISEWFRSDFGDLRTCLLDHLSGERPFGFVHDELGINMAYVRRLIDEHWAAGGLTPLHTTQAVRRHDHGQRLFALLSLSIWVRQQERAERGGERVMEARG